MPKKNQKINKVQTKVKITIKRLHLNSKKLFLKKTKRI